MHSSDNRIVFDMTHLINWKGNLTGIPRTTDEIARRLREMDNTIFVTWDESRADFVEIDGEYYYKEIEKHNRDYHKNSPSHKRNTESTHSALKARIRGHFPSLLHYAIRLRNKLRRMLNRAVTTVERPELYGSVYSVRQNDIFFIPCGTWDNEVYINKTLSYKTKGAKLVFVSYDLLPIVVPQFSGQWGGPMKDFTKKVTASCDLVFSISQFTKQDLTQWLKKQKLAIPNIAVIHLGDTFTEATPVRPSHQEFKRSGLKANGEAFILCTGTVEARKNHTLLYYAYKLAKSKGIALPKLIIAGRPGHRTENIISIIQDDPEVNEDMFILDDVNDGELAWLYNHCAFTIYPSFYEGWGLPIAESIVQGVPCICSKTSSMPEVAPGIPDYFNPCSPEECVNLIASYATNKDNCYTKAKKRTAAYTPTSWDFTFDQIIEEINVL